MQNRIFADSNIWLYALMKSSSSKKQIVSDIVLHKDINLSVQVVNEVCVNLIRKASYTDQEILLLLNNLKNKYVIFGLTYEILLKGAELRLKYNLSFWDSMIVSSALQSNCSILYTENMHH